MSRDAEQAESASRKGASVPWGVGFAQHCFMMRFQRAGWDRGAIAPTEEFSLHPGALVLHYAQSVFDGHKALLGGSEQVLLFRPMDHIRRLQRSARRMCMPPVDADAMLEGVESLVARERHLVPREPGGALYLRPTLIATDPVLGVRPSENYVLVVLALPMQPFFSGGSSSGGLRLVVETEAVRAWPGGTGAAKTGGNYAGALQATETAKKRGFDEVLWLDGRYRRYVEEAGNMNIFFVGASRRLVTPSLTDSILGGITRDTVITLAKEMGLGVDEAPVDVDDLFRPGEAGEIVECFGTGTAACVAPVGEIVYGDRRRAFPASTARGSVTDTVARELAAAHRGERAVGWTHRVC
jgi:branched-chain amino acid aminotransferase